MSSELQRLPGIPGRRRQHVPRLGVRGMVRFHRDAGLSQGRLVSDHLLLHVRVRFPICVDCRQLHGGALDRRLPPAEETPSLYPEARHYLDDVTYAGVVGVLLVLDLHATR